MNISSKGIKLIKEFESCKLTAYKAVPTEKYWTIGWGHYGPDIKQGMKITQKKADDMFNEDIKTYVINTESVIKKYAKFTPNQNQFDALVSFCYNCGIGNLTTLVKDRTATQVANSITKYNKSGGVILKGLERRRKAELDMFNIKPEDKKVKPSTFKPNVKYTFTAGSWIRKSADISNNNKVKFDSLTKNQKENFDNKEGFAYCKKGRSKKFISFTTKKDGTVFGKLSSGYFVVIQKAGCEPKVELKK